MSHHMVALRGIEVEWDERKQSYIQGIKILLRRTRHAEEKRRRKRVESEESGGIVRVTSDARLLPQRISKKEKKLPD